MAGTLFADGQKTGQASCRGLGRREVSGAAAAQLIAKPGETKTGNSPSFPPSAAEDEGAGLNAAVHSTRTSSPYVPVLIRSGGQKGQTREVWGS